jgi:hypothetical protein
MLSSLASEQLVEYLPLTLAGPIFIYINPVIRRKGIQQQGASKAAFGCQFSEPQIHNLAFRFIPSQ